MTTANDAYGPPYGDPITPEEAQQARAYLREHGGEVQQMMNEREPGLFLITDRIDAEEAAKREAESGERVDPGSEIVYSTRNDELIVAYYRRLMAEPVGIGGDGGSILDGSLRIRAAEGGE